jgi:hypothetical protein
MNLRLLIFLFFCIILFIIFKKQYIVESLENPKFKDTGTYEFSKEYKKKHKIIERGFIKKNYLNPLNERIDNNLKKLNYVMGIYKSFLKQLDIGKKN